MVPLSVGERRRYVGKARVALANAEKRFATKRKPGRGEALFKMAAGPGVYVHHGLLSVEELHRAGIDASIVNGFHKSDGPKEIAATIRRGVAQAKDDPLPVLS